MIILKDLSLLQTSTKEPDGSLHVSMHPLVKDWIQLRTERSTCQENTQIASVLLKQVLENAYNLEKNKYKLPLSIKQDLITHIRAHSENDEEHLASSTIHNDYFRAQYSLLHYLTYMTSYELARVMGVRNLARSEEKFGLADFRTVYAMDIVSNVYIFQGQLDKAQLDKAQLDKAEILCSQIIKFYKSELEEENIETLDRKSSLATIYQKQGRLKEGEELQMQVMTTCQNKMGPENNMTLRSMRDLAVTYRQQGRLKEAEELLYSSLETSSKTMGFEHQFILTCMYDLAVIYNEQGRKSEAITLVRKTVDLYTKA